MTRSRYKPELKKEAAQMIIIDGTPVSEVSKLLYQVEKEMILPTSVTAWS